MSRALWFVAGAGAGVYALTRARRAAEAFTPEGLADRLSGLAVGIRLFGAEVRAGAAEKETELRERLATTNLELSAGVGAEAPERTDESAGKDI